VAVNGAAACQTISWDSDQRIESNYSGKHLRQPRFHRSAALRIIQVSGYYPPRLGGMQNVVRELSERLASLGHDVTVYTSTLGTRQGRLASSENLKIRYCWGFEFAHTPILPGLFCVLLQIPRDAVLHIHSRPFVAEVAALVARIRGVPFVVHVHGDIQPLGVFRFLISPYKKFVWAQVMRHSAMTVFPSRHLEDSFRREYGLTNTIAIPNGVDAKYFVERKPYGNESRPFHLLFVGRLNLGKNVDFLIKTVSEISQPVEFNVVGEGEMRAKLEQLIRTLGLGHQVTLLGRRTGADLVAMYAWADVFLIASDSEGQSLAMLEAMAAGLPIVAIDAPGVTEFVESVGLVVRRRDVSMFASEVDRLLRDPVRLTQLSRQSRECARRCTWERVVDRIHSLYHVVTAP
jgi:D-inositol-3-phosphate glycosyltransferase